MEIKNSEWSEFADFITRHSTHAISNYAEDGDYVCCPFSTMERAYAAFKVWKSCHSSSEVRKYYDVDYVQYNPEYDAMEEAYIQQMEEEEAENSASFQKQMEIERCYEQQYDDCTWQPEWDNFILDREKQIVRIAHELADRYEHLPMLGKTSWASLVCPFYNIYRLNSDERALFVDEYYAQHYYRYGYV